VLFFFNAQAALDIEIFEFQVLILLAFEANDLNYVVCN